MNKTPFQLTREDVITHCIRADHEGLWVWQDDHGALHGFTDTREEAERMLRPHGVNLSLRQDQLVDLLHIIRAHKFSLEANAHIPEIRSWYERVEAIQEQVTSTIIHGKD